MLGCVLSGARRGPLTALTQFVPTMGQGNMYQAPGAAQALSVAQACQRGQVMG